MPQPFAPRALGSSAVAVAGRDPNWKPRKEHPEPERATWRVLASASWLVQRQIADGDVALTPGMSCVASPISKNFPVFLTAHCFASLPFFSTRPRIARHTELTVPQAASGASLNRRLRCQMAVGVSRWLLVCFVAVSLFKQPTPGGSGKFDSESSGHWPLFLSRPRPCSRLLKLPPRLPPNFSCSCSLLDIMNVSLGLARAVLLAALLNSPFPPTRITAPTLACSPFQASPSPAIAQPQR